MGDMAYFPAYFSYARTLEGLTDEQFGHVIRAAIQYAEHGTIPELNALEKMGFAFIKEDIDRANERYQKVCETNKRNIQKRWTKKRAEEPAEHPDDNAVTDTVVYGRMDAIPDHTNVYETYQSKSKGKSKSNSKGESIENASDDAAPAQTKTAKKQFVPPTVDEVAAYISEAGLSVDAERFVDYYAGNGWKVGSQGMKDWKATVRNWARRDKERGFTGAAKPAEKKPDPAASSFDTDEFFDAALQRTYGDNWQFFKQGAET